MEGLITFLDSGDSLEKTECISDDIHMKICLQEEGTEYGFAVPQISINVDNQFTAYNNKIRFS